MTDFIETGLYRSLYSYKRCLQLLKQGLVQLDQKNQKKKMGEKSRSATLQMDLSNLLETLNLELLLAKLHMHFFYRECKKMLNKEGSC